MSRPFRITTKSVGAPLSFDEMREKYGASAKDAAEVRGFVYGLSTEAVHRVFSKKFKGKVFGGKSRTSAVLKAGKAAGKTAVGKERHVKTRSVRSRKARKK